MRALGMSIDVMDPACPEMSFQHAMNDEQAPL
jgi:hypothetical protein